MLFVLPVIMFFAAVAVAFVVGGPNAAFVVAVLSIFEVAMSFNNAVINATVLRRMNAFWQRMFLTVGLAIAVIGMRLIFPVLLVAVTANLGFGSVIDLALHHPAEYADKLTLAHPAIAAFGAMFLLMLFLDFVIDESKDVHWFKFIEKPLARAGRFKTLSILIALTGLWLVSVTWAGANAPSVLMAGVAGMVLYLLVRVLSQVSLGMSHDTPGVAIGMAALLMFIYLEVLDASFSLDGVVGAFAITNSVLQIALGLGVGALFVRDITVLVVRHHTLSRFQYLEHGAQYSVGALAVLLAAGLAYDIPGVVTGIIGMVIIGLSLVTSLPNLRKAS